MMDDAGIGIVRQDVIWAEVEKQPGQYDFSQQDALVQQLETHHTRLLFIIDYGNPLYDGGQAPCTGEGRAASAVGHTGESIPVKQGHRQQVSDAPRYLTVNSSTATR